MLYCFQLIDVFSKIWMPHYIPILKMWSNDGSVLDRRKCLQTDTVDFEILLRRLETSYRLHGTVLQWLTSFITDRTKAVAFGGKTFSHVKLICGVLQGSVLKPLLFVLSAADDMKIAQSHGVHIQAYADDMQTYISCKAVNQIAATCQIESCVEDIDGWLLSNRLKFNADKTEFIWLGTHQQLLKVTHQSLVINGVSVRPVSKVRDLGIITDEELTVDVSTSYGS